MSECPDCVRLRLEVERLRYQLTDFHNIDDVVEIRRLRDALAAIAAPGPLEQCTWQTNCARKALHPDAEQK